MLDEAFHNVLVTSTLLHEDYDTLRVPRTKTSGALGRNRQYNAVMKYV